MMRQVIVALAVCVVLATSAAADVRRVAGGGAASGSVATNAYVDASRVACLGGAVRAVASSRLNIVQRILPDGTLQDEAGTTLQAQTGAAWNGRSLSTSFTPQAFDVDPGGRYYVVGTRSAGGYAVYRVMGPDIEIFAQPGGGVNFITPTAIKATRDHVWVADGGVGKLYGFSQNCAGPTCQPVRTISGLSVPRDVTASEDGSLLYVLETSGGRIKRVNADDTTTIIASGLGTPGGFDLAPDGNLYVADTTSSRVLQVTPSGVVTVVAGTGQPQNQSSWIEVGPGIPATLQPITRPSDVAVCGSALLVTSTDDKRVYAIDLSAGPTPTMALATPTHSPVPTNTAVVTATRTRTWTPTAPPTATATAIPTCAAGQFPNCIDPSQSM